MSREQRKKLSGIQFIREENRMENGEGRKKAGDGTGNAVSRSRSLQA